MNLAPNVERVESTGESDAILQAVFDDTTGDDLRRRWQGRWSAIALAIGLHVGLLWAAANRPSLETWSAEMATLIHEEIAKTAANSDRIRQPRRRTKRLEHAGTRTTHRTTFNAATVCATTRAFSIS
ncbi:MAG: hypothetical protein R3A47_03485 [Polyangiales bacterium]